MAKKLVLDSYEQDIEDNFEKQIVISNVEAEIAKFKKVAASHVQRKKSITLRVNEMDLEAVKLKASKTGVPYQTYINMIIHKDATSV